jgi:hypothetical protein
MDQLAALLFVAICSDILAFVFQPILYHKQKSSLSVELKMESDTSFSTNKRGARVAFIGNSIQYFNDTPRFLTNLSRQTNSYATIPDKPYDAFIECQDSCFRGGVSLVGVWQQGNAMLKHGYASNAAISGIDEDGNNIYDVGAPTVQDLMRQKEWDFVVMNDHTQGPARVETREATIDILVEKYAPLISKSQAVPVVIETAAYRYRGINNSQDLGTTQEFQQKVKEGVQKYIEVLRANLPSSISPLLAPVGAAYLYVHDNDLELWEQLFDSFDNFHPSPKGTFLQGCVLFYTMFSCLPPLPSTEQDMIVLWKDARMMNCVGRTEGYETMSLPSVEEANYLCHVAEVVCRGSKSNL